MLMAVILFVKQVMMLRNHGVVCCGESIEEAWYNTYHTVLACETQVWCCSMIRLLVCDSSVLSGLTITALETHELISTLSLITSNVFEQVKIKPRKIQYNSEAG